MLQIGRNLHTGFTTPSPRGFTAPSEKQHERAGSCSSSDSVGNPRNRGFTLVETLVAITVVVMAIVGPLYAVQQSLNMSRSAREQLIASSLAQEGVEYVRGVRDSNYIYNLASPGSRAWLSGIDGTAGSPGAYANCITGDCVIDATQNTVSRTVVPLSLSTTGLYNQAGSGTVTGFTRTVRLTAVPGSTTEMVLTVTVTWTTKGQTRSVIINERLHNWL